MADDSSAIEAVQLDIAKLKTITEEAQQQLYVMSFLNNLEKLVNRLDEDGASAYQLYVKKELFKIITLSAPAPTRLVRNISGRCFAGIFGKGDRKLLFETINELVGLINTGKSDKDLRIRHAAVHCVGEVYRAAGDSAMALSTLTCTSLLKLLKPAQNHCGLRSSIFRALGKVFSTVRDMADEAVARDVWKQARNVAVGEKSALVQASALQCMEELLQATQLFNSHQEYDKLQSVAMKALDSTSTSARKAAASCWSLALVLAYSTEVPELAKVAKKPKKMKRVSTAVGDDEGLGVERPSSPAPSGKKAIVRLTFTLEEILRQLSLHYTKPSTSPRARAGIALCYSGVLERLGSSVVESNYGLISSHLLNDLLSHHAVIANRFRLLTTRKYVRTLLEDVIGRRLLGETGQLNAIKTLVNDTMKDYPQVIKEKPEPSKHALTGALHALASLIQSLGSALASVQDTTRDGLLQVLQHPSYSVQVATSWCLRGFVIAAPSQLLPIITICMNNVNRELSQMTARRPTTTEILRRCAGYANGLAAAISTAPLQPLYASVDITSRILTLATSLLKSSGDYDLRISATQIQVAWILIGGLMALGPNFVKIHLSQLLLLWKNALPKPLAKDSSVERSFLELSFLAHVRECALGSILSFLEFNSRLLTADVSKRIAAMLQNSTLFLNTLPAKKTTDDISQRLSPSLQLIDLDLMVRRRVLQCYAKLVKLSHGEALQANLLTIAVSFFADPDKYTPSSLSTAIASSAGNFESLWDIGDNYAYGVCGFVKGFDVEAFAFEAQGTKPTIAHWITRGSPEARINETKLHTPVIGSIEHDSVSLYTTSNSSARNEPTPAPPATAVVNSAIDLFTILLPIQPPKVQESILEQIATFLASGSLQRDPGRKAAMVINVAVALLGALKVTISEEVPSASLSTASVLKIIQELLQGFVIHPDPYVRNVAYEALGRLCSIGGNSFTGNMINWCVETIVNNRDPNARAGCAVALGCIHSYVGGMAAGFHLKTIIGILMSLSNDPHPTVHFWALDGLARTIDSAGLTFSGFVTSTLGMLSQLYVAETHNEEVATVVSSNLELELPTLSIVVRCIDSLIGVLGPDLQDMVKTRELILTNVGQFLREPDYTVQLEALRCLEHLSLFAASHVDTAGYVKRLQKELGSEYVELRDVAIDGLYQLMKGDAERIVNTADPGLEEQLWIALDEAPEHEGIRNIINNWLNQTGIEDVGKWVGRCQAVMSKLVERKDGIAGKLENEKPTNSGAVDLNDDEVASFAVASSREKENSQPTGQELLRWQVRTFAMNCLFELLSLAAREMQRDSETPVEESLVQKIADVIRMAFSASTSNVVQLRLAGLRIVDQVLKMFGYTPDPDFPEATLLEQYQAQIGSALTPAFAVDSSPELASEAVNVCAGFISTGIVKDVDRMGRILRLLTSALENFSSDSEVASIGDLKGLSSNAQVMVKMAVLRAWAELQVASKEQSYLADVVKPHIATLAPLWLSSLREFARLRFEPDISTNSTGATTLGGSIDTIYSALNRETLLQFYQDSWLKLVDAIASLIEQDSQFVFDALDGKASSGDVNGNGVAHDINYRDEPVAFFFVLFGIAFEALVGRPGVDSLATKEQTLEILLALKKILHPSVCGHAIYQEAIFSETMDLFDRLVLTEGLAVQSATTDIAKSLCVEHPTARSKSGAQGENLTEDIDQLFELTRLMVLVLARLLPNVVDKKTMVRHHLSEEAANLVRVSLDALVHAAEVFPAVIRMDLYASILHIFTSIFGTGVCQTEVVPRSLPIFKRFIRIITNSSGGNDSEMVVMQVRSCLSSILQILDNAKIRGDAALPCLKNCLMASTIVITTGVNVLPPNDEQVPLLCDRMIDALSNPATSKMAVQCSRSILMVTPKTACDQEMVRYMIPRLITFVTTTKGDSEEGSDQTKFLVCHILTSFVSTLFGDQIQVAMALLIPTLLAHASSNPGSYPETAKRLLELVAVSQLAFKNVVANMGAGQRGFMEEILRSNARSIADSTQQQSSAPTIALKMNFG
ncbi:armadillo-type protein [Tuber borchii]|uniref:Armadillo-type protein n=1 Tax=Tuber borchii TaxID=42251 RepID=A0A2T6ZRT6_TUBBO|nr:armadillo-type protein [Tuber borchii]